MSIGRVLTIYVGLMLVTFLSSTDQTIVATALPTVVADIGGLAQYSWIFTAYLLAATISIPLYGKLGDVYGKRPLLLTSISCFSWGRRFAGSRARCRCSSHSGRCRGSGRRPHPPLDGDGRLDRPAERPWQVPGLDRRCVRDGAGVGPLLGGLIVDHSSWPWIFYVNIPFGLLAFVVIFTKMSNPRHASNRPIDWLGAGTLAVASMSLMLGLLWGGAPTVGARSRWWPCSSTAASFTAAFVYVERRAREPILPFDVLGLRPVASSVLCYALGGVVTLGTITYVPLFVQGVIGSSATESGLVLWPQFLGAAVISFIVGQWISRSGRLRPTALIGPLFMTAGLLLLWHMGADATTREIARNTLLTGIGWGMMAQVFILSVQNAVPRSMITSATALMVFSRSMGAAVGVAAMGAIVNHGLPHGTKLDPTSLGVSHGDSPSRIVLAHAITPAFFAAAIVAALILPVASYGVRNVSLRRSVDEDPRREAEVAPAAVSGSN